jgi:choline-glycine betaine transporter
MYQKTGLAAFAAIAWALLSLVSLVVAYLLYRTAQAVVARSICVPSH